MDVAKYIGLFLLKNKFAYVHGLGNLEIKKKPAAYEGEALTGSVYEIELTPMGSIDDNLANFIATNEQISISKASNALRDFSTEAREKLEQGETVSIPSIGIFAEENGKIVFITDPHFQFNPTPIPSIRVARKKDETVYTTNADIPPVKPRYIDPQPREEEKGFSALKIAAWILGLIILGALAYFGIRYMNDHNSTEVAPLINLPEQDTVPQTIPPIEENTLTHEPETEEPQPAMKQEDGMLSFEVILNSYHDRARAEKRTSQLKSYGNHVSLKSARDSSEFYVVLPLEKIAPPDTSRILDSLGRVFNPSQGVKIYQP